MVEISDMARAASLEIPNARPFLIGNRNDLRKVTWAVEPAKGCIWPKDLLSAVGSLKGGTINDFYAA